MVIFLSHASWQRYSINGSMRIFSCLISYTCVHQYTVVFTKHHFKTDVPQISNFVKNTAILWAIEFTFHYYTHLGTFVPTYTWLFLLKISIFPLLTSLNIVISIFNLKIHYICIYTLVISKPQVTSYQTKAIKFKKQITTELQNYSKLHACIGM